MDVLKNVIHLDAETVALQHCQGEEDVHDQAQPAALVVVLTREPTAEATLVLTWLWTASLDHGGSAHWIPELAPEDKPKTALIIGPLVSAMPLPLSKYKF